MKKYITCIEDLERIYQSGQTVSFESLESGDYFNSDDHSNSRGSMYLSDKGKSEEDTYSNLQTQWWMGKLTRKQQKVISAMQNERKRRKVAKGLGVSLQAVNQIILRIRQRIEIYQAMRD